MAGGMADTRFPALGGHAGLDLGCGRAITSIFLAKEFDVQVWATGPVDHTEDHDNSRLSGPGRDKYFR